MNVECCASFNVVHHLQLTANEAKNTIDHSPINDPNISSHKLNLLHLHLEKQMNQLKFQSDAASKYTIHITQKRKSIELKLDRKKMQGKKSNCCDNGFLMKASDIKTQMLIQLKKHINIELSPFHFYFTYEMSKFHFRAHNQIISIIVFSYLRFHFPFL